MYLQEKHELGQKLSNNCLVSQTKISRYIHYIRLSRHATLLNTAVDHFSTVL